MPKYNRNPCPECGDRLELDDSERPKIWRCTGLVDPENNQAELQPCDYQRDYRSRVETAQILESALRR